MYELQQTKLPNPSFKFSTHHSMLGDGDVHGVPDIDVDGATLGENVHGVRVVAGDSEGDSLGDGDSYISLSSELPKDGSNSQRICWTRL